MNNVKPTLCLKKISKSFKQGSQNLEVLKGVDLEIMPGEIVALIGPSGSGKSTLLQIAGLLDRPSKGEITLDEMKCSKLGDGMRTALRRDYLGFVYQYHNLLADFDAIENVMLPQLIAGVNAGTAREKSRWLLERLGLGKRLKHRPAELSGGEQQMLAMGRALMSNASMLMLDEPSMGLSPLLVQEIFDIIRNIHKEGMTILLVEQNAQMALSVADRAYVLETGRVVMEGTGAELLTNERVRSAYLGG